jgi:hypothetical protein
MQSSHTGTDGVIWKVNIENTVCHMKLVAVWNTVESIDTYSTNEMSSYCGDIKARLAYSSYFRRDIINRI